MVAVVDAETLILGAKEDGADDVAGDEEEEEAIMEMWMAVCVEDTQQNQACCACNATDNAEPGEDLLRRGCVACEPAGVP